MTTVGDLTPYVVGVLVTGGVAVGLSRRREFIRRWCAWAVAVPVVLLALHLGPPGTAALVAAVGLVCAAEYGRLANLPLIDRCTLSTVIVALALVAWLAPAQLPRLLAVSLLIVGVVPVLAGDAEHGLHRLTYGVLGLAWLAPLLLVVVVVQIGPVALAVFVAVSVADIGAYFGGRLLKGPRLSPLSPAKRWSGVLVGAAVGLAALGLLGALGPATAAAVVLGAPLGDLVESMIKRGSGVKDTGAWIPGSGGLLDRLDSLLVALAVLAVLPS